ncbi:hypothetical protein BJY04DRAFT_202739 [Aspergillus karnatakaensis]|uniref:putative autophagy regulatory protein Atg2 n=1 Tax=Aspergillus karnatakaensis TaxID=1810916 RepID=UPI003CCDC80D
MSYFLPSFVQKRLLKYALSRLELVDTEALDLDSLGVRWGQRSTVEVRDIGLRLEKLATLANLPASSKLLRARIQSLKLTVPADIYSSGISCEVSGVDVHLRLPSEKDVGATRETVFSAYQTSHDKIIPNPADLAQSFLQTEPKEEKEELQAAISSQSQLLQRTSSSISDDEEELGLGNEAVSLPSFIAAFLRGVADRLQVQVEDISIRLDVETKQEGSIKRQPEDKPDLISGLLSIRQISVGAVATAATSSEHPSHAGKRPISLSDINFALVSEPVVFSNYSRFTAPGSPSTPQPSKPSQPSSPSASIPPAPSSASSSTHAMMQSTIFESHHSVTSTPEGHKGSSRLEESSYTHDGRFSDADTEGARSHGSLEDSQDMSEEERLLDNPAYLDSVIDSHLQDDDLDSLDNQPPDYLDLPDTDDSTPRLQNSGLQASGSESQGITPRSDLKMAVAVSEPNVRDIQQPHPTRAAQSSTPNLPSFSGVTENAGQTPQQIALSPYETDGSDSASSYFNDELSESKLFSNEEAQSMYMSAMSHGSDSRSFIPSIPGAWDSPEATLSTHATQRPHASSHQIESSTVGQEDQDTTPISTPKPADHPKTYPSGYGGLDEPHENDYELSDKQSESPLSLNEISDVTKRLLIIDRVTIWVPAKHDREHQDPSESIDTGSESDSFKDSTAHLAWSQARDKLVSSLKTSSSFRSHRDSTDMAFAGESTDIKPDKTQGPTSPRSDNAIHIEISSIDIQFDIALGWLAVKFGQRVLQAFGDNSQTGKAPKNNEQDPQSFSLTLSRFSIKFVELIPEHPYVPGKEQALFTAIPGFLHDDIIIQATASGFRVHYSSIKDTAKLSAHVSKFTFGFASEDLISFSEDMKMRESTRDIGSPTGDDITLSLSKSPGAATFSISTLPLCINLNTQRLEEAIGWFGGLSTIMELGSSISSIAGNKTPKKDVPKRARGVHFEGTSLPPPKTSVRGTPWKVNVRVGGLALDVAGENHYLTLRTTAAKIVSRSEALALQIDKAKLSGPFSHDDSKDAPAEVILKNIRVEFLDSPKETDLDRLLYLITPSKDKYDEDDDIMLDTLFRQRKQGSVLRVTVAGVNVNVTHIPDLGPLQQLGEELGRLSNVAKYLPEDDRPGILTLALIREFEAQLHVGGKVGIVTANLGKAEVAHISIPSLVAAQVGSAKVVRNSDEELLGAALPSEAAQMPALMARFIADEMDPTIKIKLHGLRVEYTIPSMTALLGISEEMTSGDVASNMASSSANFAELQPPTNHKEDSSVALSKPTKLTVALRDCVLGLNPRGTVARGLVVLSDASFGGTIHDLSSEAHLNLRKASIMIIDDVSNVGSGTNVPRWNALIPQSNQIQSFMDLGYVSVSSISSATATVKIMSLAENGTKSLDVEIRDDLLILETCADSTQTLISIMNGLQPPTPPSQVTKYRTEVVPINDMLASFTGDAFTAIQPEDTLVETVDRADIPEHDELEYVSDFYPHPLNDSTISGSNEFGDSFHSQYVVSSSVSELDFRDDHFTQQSSVGGTAHRWDSTQNTYGLSDDSKFRNSPLRVRIRDAHVIWNLFDGYDWQRTRDTISKAVKDVEKKATERRTRAGSRASPNFDQDEDVVIGDCLFNSIYINIPANRDASDLRGDINQEINRNIDDLISETGSYATTSTITTARNKSPSMRGRKLRLSRSKAHKMTFELKGISADLVVFPPGSGETQNSLDVRVKELEIFDHLPSSTWKKFATYMREAGEKETGTSMMHLEILTVRPVSELAASELVLKATILPLRLHVDQDALDFLSRFFEFRDDSAPAPGPPQEPPYIQRAEINAIPVKLDFKPKHVDYASLRSGRTTEFMNFMILDEADMVMRHVIVYGSSGFDRLGQTLNDIWMPDVKQNQLPGVLAGLAPFRSLVNVGSGVKDLVVVPMREYRKDGRIVRSIQKGALAFAKTTSNELVKLGAKLAIGTQTVLQSAEEMLTTPAGQLAGDEDEEIDEEATKKISLYADQPVGVVQGLRGAFRGLERDLLLTRDAIIAVPGELAESGSAKAAARAVLKRAPTVILRPAIGVSKAVGQTLLGAGNSLDPSNRRKIEDKYKRH